MTRLQRTIRQPVTLEGVGIHLGKPARVEVQPAASDTGRVFVRDGVEIPALVSSVSRLERCTTLSQGEASVSTVEHLLSACAGLQLDNLRILVDGPEIPILDGSALPFTRALQSAEPVEQDRPAPVHVLKKPVWVAEEGAMILALPNDEAVLEYSVHYRHPMISYQHIVFRPGAERFLAELAPARTYGFYEEVAALLERGLALGGDLSNALVIRQDGFTSPLRFPEEPARHKCLDLVGDLALLGSELQARVIAVMAGHRLHVELARRILKEDPPHAGHDGNQAAAAPPLSLPALGPGPGAG